MLLRCKQKRKVMRFSLSLCCVVSIARCLYYTRKGLFGHFGETGLLEWHYLITRLSLEEAFVYSDCQRQQNCGPLHVAILVLIAIFGHLALSFSQLSSLESTTYITSATIRRQWQAFSLNVWICERASRSRGLNNLASMLLNRWGGNGNERIHRRNLLTFD